MVLRADGSFDYTPPPDANGVAMFPYTVNDGAETATADAYMAVNAVNDPPSFAIGANRTHAAATSGAQTVPGFVSGVSMGPPDEAGQSLAALTAAIDSDPSGVLVSLGFAHDGTLNYQLTGRGGTATVSVRARDNGGTSDGGSDTSTARTFTIAVASGVDLVVDVANDRSFIVGGSKVTYSINVRNLGPDAANQARVSVAQPANAVGFAWTCSRSDSTPCAVATGTGALQQFVNVPIGVAVTFAVRMTALSQPEAPLTLQAVVMAGAGQTDVHPANNSASDTDPIGIFAHGFDG